MSVRYLDLVDYLLVAEATLGVEVEVLKKIAQLHLADSALGAPAAEFGGVEFYPDFNMKASVLCSRLVRNHPLPDGNKRVGYMCTVEFIERNGYSWVDPLGDNSGGDETVNVIEEVAAGHYPELELADWMKHRIEGA